MSPWILAVFLFASTLVAQTKGASPGSLPPAGSPQAPKTTAAPRPAPVLGSAQQDKGIEDAIRAKLAKSKIGKDGFKVRVQGGVAYWEGTTNVIQHKGSATRMAKSAGAKSVVNNITVSDAAKGAASANLEQGRRRVQIQRGEPRGN